MPRVRRATTAAVSEGAASASVRWGTVMVGGCLGDAALPPLSRLRPPMRSDRARPDQSGDLRHRLHGQREADDDDQRGRDRRDGGDDAAGDRQPRRAARPAWTTAIPSAGQRRRQPGGERDDQDEPERRSGAARPRRAARRARTGTGSARPRRPCASRPRRCDAVRAGRGRGAWCVVVTVVVTWPWCVVVLVAVPEAAHAAAQDRGADAHHEQPGRRASARGRAARAGSRRRARGRRRRARSRRRCGSR